MKERIVKPGLPIPQIGHIEAFAMIVDLNGFTPMVEKAECANDSIAQFTRDALAGAIFEIEAEGGEVVGFMGDAILGILPDGDSAAKACFGIAKDTDRLCEWISNCQAECKGGWEYAPGGPSLKISVEYGWMDVSTIDCRLLGEHRLLIGNPINYAARICEAGVGNRCIIGPAAAKLGFSQYTLDGPHTVPGKPGELDYPYYFFDLGHIWIDGPREPGKETFWG